MSSHSNPTFAARGVWLRPQGPGLRAGVIFNIRRQALLLCLACFAVAPVHAQSPAKVAPDAAKTAGAPLLPQTLGTLRLTAPAVTQVGAEAAAADAAHAPLLREDGLLDAAQGTYTGTGAAMSVRAYRFADATGAYAAYTAYHLPQMRREPLGTDGASLGTRYLFWTGSTLVDATLAQPDPQALATLGALSAALPRPRGPASIAPPLPGYLPAAGLDQTSIHYAVGPAGYAASGAVLPESVIDFSRDAEVAVAHYTRHGSSGTLTLIEYPTPQIAITRQKAIAALLKSGAPPLTVGDPALVAEQVGPLVALTGGSLSSAEAHALVREVHYDAFITINHPEGYVSEVSKAAKLLLGIAYLTGVLAVAAVLLALFLGSGRVLLRRMRGKPDSSMNDDDFISLKI